MSSVRTANFCNNFADGNDEELLIARCCRRHSFHGNLCVLNICFFYRAFNHLIIVSRCRCSWVLQRWETFNFQVGPDNTFTVQYLYPARHSLDKNTHYWAVLSSESHVVQNATQNLVDRISRADAAPEQLMLRCLFFFSFLVGFLRKLVNVAAMSNGRDTTFDILTHRMVSRVLGPNQGTIQIYFFLAWNSLSSDVTWVFMLIMHSSLKGFLLFNVLTIAS